VVTRPAHGITWAVPARPRVTPAGTVIDHVPVRLDVVAADAVDVYAPRSLAPHLLALWASA
jgi:hypothetical protein